MMGQTSSRLITSVAIKMSYLSSQCKNLGKVLQVLASRARHGAFRRLELEWSQEDFLLLRDIAFWGPMNSDYDELLEGLNQGSEACKYERTIRLPEVKAVSDSEREGFDTLAEELHLAFGGKLLWGEMLLWENYHRKSKLPEADNFSKKSE
jgi:hypothetical protein